MAIIIIIDTTADSHSRWKASKAIDGSTLDVSVRDVDARVEVVTASPWPTKTDKTCLPEMGAPPP